MQQTDFAKDLARFLRRDAGLCQCGCGLPAPIAIETKRPLGHIKGQPLRFIWGHSHTKHGMSYTPEYTAFRDAQRRCKPGGHKDYAGRGIKFLFTSFEQFYAALGPRPEGKSLDREDNDGHYEPGNVRWATKQEQQSNQRRQKKAA